VKIRVYPRYPCSITLDFLKQLDENGR